MKKKLKSSRGGVRAGAGRPATGNARSVRLQSRYTVAEAVKIESAARAKKQTPSGLQREIVLKSLGED